MTSPVTVLMWPVKVTLSLPSTRSQNLIVLSLDPEQKNLFWGSTARLLTQPVCPLMTVFSFHGACHLGSMNFLCRNATEVSFTFNACTKLCVSPDSEAFSFYLIWFKAFWVSILISIVSSYITSKGCCTAGIASRSLRIFLRLNSSTVIPGISPMFWY